MRPRIQRSLPTTASVVMEEDGVNSLTSHCTGARAVLTMKDPAVRYLYLPVYAKNGFFSNYKANLKKAAEPLMAGSSRSAVKEQSVPIWALVPPTFRTTWMMKLLMRE